MPPELMDPDCGELVRQVSEGRVYTSCVDLIMHIYIFISQVISIYLRLYIYKLCILYKLCMCIYIYI